VGVKTEDEIRELIATKLGVDRRSLDAAASLADLGVDSLDIVELVMAVEEEFGIDLDLR
jgi:acyl carrier protein